MSSQTLVGRVRRIIANGQPVSVYDFLAQVAVVPAPRVGAALEPCSDEATGMPQVDPARNPSYTQMALCEVREFVAVREHEITRGTDLHRARIQAERERIEESLHLAVLFGDREVAGARFTSGRGELGGGSVSIEMRLGDWPPPNSLFDNVSEYVERAPDAAGHVSAVRPLDDIEADLARAAAAPEAGSRAKTRRAKLRQRADASIARAREAQSC